MVLLIIILILALIAGGVGLAVHALIWLFWIGLIVLVIGLIWGFVGKVFTSGRNTGSGV